MPSPIDEITAVRDALERASTLDTLDDVGRLTMANVHKWCDALDALNDRAERALDALADLRTPLANVASAAVDAHRARAAIHSGSVLRNTFRLPAERAKDLIAACKLAIEIFDEPTRAHEIARQAERDLATLRAEVGLR